MSVSFSHCRRICLIAELRLVDAPLAFFGAHVGELDDVGPGAEALLVDRARRMDSAAWAIRALTMVPTAVMLCA